VCGPFSLADFQNRIAVICPDAALTTRVPNSTTVP